MSGEHTRHVIVINNVNNHAIFLSSPYFPRVVVRQAVVRGGANSRTKGIAGTERFNGVNHSLSLSVCLPPCIVFLPFSPPLQTTPRVVTVRRIRGNLVRCSCLSVKFHHFFFGFASSCEKIIIVPLLFYFARKYVKFEFDFFLTRKQIDKK